MIEHTAIEGVLLITPPRHGDARGFVSEVFKASVLRDAGVTHGWAQDNHAVSPKRGVVRGMHFQAPPHAQAKLVRVTRGAILDVVVDIRVGSPSYGAHVAAVLSAENWTQLYAPAGFAHGYCTLTDDVEVAYKMSAEYAPASEAGLLWNDPALAIAWPVDAQSAIVAPRDAAWPPLSALRSPF